MARLPFLNQPSPVTSLLDVDYYKFTMGDFVLRRFPGVRVRYRLVCRTPEARLARRVPEAKLREVLEAIRSLRFSPGQLEFLEGLPPPPGFSREFLAFLARLRLPPFDLEVRGDEFHLEIEASWPETILWETLILSALSELLARAGLGGGGAGALRDAEALGRERLEAKIVRLREHPGVRFASFGTRRRFSRRWQLEVEDRLARALPGQFLGASSVESARQLGVAAVGTVAHEVFMVGAGIAGETDEGLADAPVRLLDLWWDAWGEPGSVFLTDTWGSESFFAAVGPERARRFRGLRHDSGPPAPFAERALRWYRGAGVDPAGKSLVFSDGLELPVILDLHRRFGRRIRTTFGWGTNLTNDCGTPVWSLVVKPVEADGRPLVKLSDNPGKSVGPPDEIARYRRVFNAPELAATLPKY